MIDQSRATAQAASRAEQLDEDWVLAFSLLGEDRPSSASRRWAERGGVCAFFYGLLFDREALARSYGGVSPNASDAELVLSAYEQGGDEALSRLRGSFVVAVKDRARGRTIVSRDPIGTHPLFYVETGSQILFAASIQALLDQPGVSRSLNRAALADHIASSWPVPDETFFSSVRRVPPGWRAVLSGGRLEFEHYWNPFPEDRPIQWLDEAETARFDELFDRAVDRCLAAGPTAIFLSGGLDSISVAAVATDRVRQTGRPPPLALSLIFDDPACNEESIQTSVARDLGLRHKLLGTREATGPRPLIEQAIELNRGLSAPLQNTWLPMYLVLAGLARRDGARTILTGEGGDEWLTVSPYLAADLMHRGALVELAQLYFVLLRSYANPPLAVTRNTFWTFGLRPLAAMAAHRLMPRAFDANRLRRMLAGDPGWLAPDPGLRQQQARRAEKALVNADPPHGFYVREVLTGLNHPLVCLQAEERHEIGRQHGVCFMHPFWDADLVEMLCRVPPRLLNDGGRSKGLVRASLARRFPALGFERQRKVHATDYYRKLITDSASTLAALAGDFPALSALGVVDGKAARADLLGGLNGANAFLPKFYHIVNLEMWARLHI